MPQYDNRIDWLMQRGSGCEINDNETDWLGNKVFLISFVLPFYISNLYSIFLHSNNF